MISMIYTQSDVQQEISAFKNSLSKRSSDKYQKLKSIKDHEAISTAVDLAYNDAKRTLSGIHKQEPQKRHAIKGIKNGLGSYFSKQAPSSEPDYDSFHSSLCQAWCDSFSGTDIGTYGKAQKIVNMSFKYLRCCDDASEYSDHFRFCHMPLDSFTLEWFKRTFASDPTFAAGKMTPWSSLEDDASEHFTRGDKEFYSYRFYLCMIRKHITNSGYKLSPLELEFIIWPQIQKELAAEDFLFGLKETLSINDKREIRGLPLDEKYARIADELNKRISAKPD